MALRMGSISRYIFRTTFGVFLVVLISLTALIWVTQALRDIDLITSNGQSVLTFVGITGLIIPFDHGNRADRTHNCGDACAQ